MHVGHSPSPHYVQVLLTGHDFMAEDSLQNLLHTLNCILDMKIIPVLNTNDVHSVPPHKDSDLKDVR